MSDEHGPVRGRVVTFPGFPVSAGGGTAKKSQPLMTTPSQVTIYQWEIAVVGGELRRRRVYHISQIYTIKDLLFPPNEYGRGYVRPIPLPSAR